MAQKPGGFSAGRGLLSPPKTLNFSSGRSAPGAGRGRGQEPGGGAQSEHLSSTSLKLFSSLGLSPSDLDALAQIPEDQISVETLPHILRQLKNRKNRENFSDWDEQMDREGPRERDFPYRQESGQGFGRNFGASGDFSHHDFGMAPQSESSGYMQGHMGQPSQSKVEDFVGLNPARFPHVCSLCDFDVHSILDWNQHINGLRHAENRRVLLNLYPEWDPPLASNRSGNMDTPNMSAGILGPAPMSSQASGWGGGAAMSGMNPQGQPIRSRVVRVKYERKPLSNKSIFNFVEPFGRLREHLVLKNMAFLEMSSHDEALDVVNYYQQNPASLGGKSLKFELSKRPFIEKQEQSHPVDRPMDRMDRPMDRMDRPLDRMDRPMDRMDRPMDRMDRPLDRMDRPMDRPVERGLDMNPGGSQVVYFSNLPREDEKKKDLLVIAGRFGTVEKHLFLAAEGFIQLASPRDAEMMVKYYSMNPLVVRGRDVRLNICTKYKTLNVKRGRDGRRGDDKQSPGSRTGSRPSRFSSPRRSSNRRTSSSPKRSKSPSPRRSSSKKTSPGPKTRTREERKKEERPKSKPAPKSDSKPESRPEAEPAEAEPDSEPKADAQQESESEKNENLSIKQEPESEGDTEAHKDVQDSNGDEHPEDTPEEVGVAEGQVEPEKTDDNVADAEESNAENMETDLHEDEEDFMDNMDDMVVLDELDDEDGAEREDESKGGMRVVVVMGFRKGYNYIKDILQLAQPFGKVVRHLVLDMRTKAYLQFSTEEEARAMAKFYNGNVQASICGRPVKIFHYLAHPTIQSGRVVYIGQIPNVDYDEEDILKFMEPFGKITRFFLNKIRKECFIEMSRSEEAEKVTEHYRTHPLMFHGKRLTTYVSRKYRELRGRHVTNAADKRASKQEKRTAPRRKSIDEPPNKKTREEEEEEEKEEQETEEEKTEEEGGEETHEETHEEKEETSKDELDEEEPKDGGETKEESECEEEHEEQGEETTQEEEEEGARDDREEEREDEEEEEKEEEEPPQDQDSEHEEDAEEEMETSLDMPFLEAPPSDSEAPPSDSEATPPASLPLPPYDPDTPLGVEHVKLGFYCRVCFLFYTNEEAAKQTHCSSKAHYDQLQKYLEKTKTGKEKAAPQ